MHFNSYVCFGDINDEMKPIVIVRGLTCSQKHMIW